MKILRRSLLFCVLCIPLISQAAEINFSGFATIAGGKTLDDDEFLEGYDDTFDFKSNSLLAIQASADLGDGWGVTTQILSRGSEDWDIKSEWAFISYDANDNWRLLFGRQRIPFYIYSDFLDVSYAYHWIKPPSEVYAVPFDTLDGIGSIYSTSFGSFDSTFHMIFGRNQDDADFFDIDRATDFRDIFGAAWSLNKDWFTLRLSYAKTDYDIPLDEATPLFDSWRATPFAGIGDDLEIKDDKGTFTGAGIIIDYESFLLVTEFTQVKTGENFFPEQESAYITLGKRFDNFMLHVTYGTSEGTTDDILAGVPRGTPLDALILATEQLLISTEQDVKFYTVGFRWDVSDSVAFKAEYTNNDNEHILGTENSIIQFALTTVF